MADNDQDQTPEGGDTQQSAPRRGRGRAADGSDRAQAPDPKNLNFFRVVPDNPNIDFIGNRKRGLMLSLFMVFVSLAALLFNSVTSGSALNYGIDFQGGSSVRIALSQEADIEQIRGLLEEAGYSGSSAVAVPDAKNEVLIKVKEVLAIGEDELAVCQEALTGLSGGAALREGDGFVHPSDSSKIFMKFTAQPGYPEIEQRMADAGCIGTASPGTGKPEEFPVEFALIGVGNDIAQMLDQELGEGTVDHIVQSETVGAKVGKQLKTDGIQAMLIAISLIFVYVMFRFDIRFAPGGIIALTHDAIIVVGAFAITGKEFNLTTIAALLTIIGYSINDTIVVFDRVRERVALYRNDPIAQTTNRALNDTLSRTILTSATTLVVVLATWVLGSGAIKDFAFAVVIGLIVGTYSSIFVASPVFLYINDKWYQGKGHLLMLEEGVEAQQGTGTLLGGEAAVEHPDDGRPVQAAAEEEADERLDVSAAPREEDGDADEPGTGSAIDDLAGIKIEDVDKNATERKTRRRRRQPKE
jgi:preprotein translocase subunit SecF